MTCRTDQGNVTRLASSMDLPFPKYVSSSTSQRSPVATTGARPLGPMTVYSAKPQAVALYLFQWQEFKRFLSDLLDIPAAALAWRRVAPV